MNFKRCFSLQFVAVVTAFCFLFSSLGNAAAVPAPISVEPSQPFSINDFHLPGSLGSVEFRESASAQAPNVILIQDAHALVDAQVKIQKLIQYLHEKHRVDLVALEGSRDEWDTTLLRNFPDDVIKKKVFSEYLNRAEITGAGMAALLQTDKVRFHGMEDWELYEKNYFAYARAGREKEKVLKALAEVRSRWNMARQTVFSEELNGFFEKEELFRDSKTQLGEWILDLEEYGKNLSADTRKSMGARYPDLAALSASLRARQNSGHNAALELSISQKAKAFHKKVFPKLSSEDQKIFNSRYQSFQSGQEDPGSFIQFMCEMGERYGFQSKLEGSLREAFENSRTLATLKGTRLFEELEAYTLMVREPLIESAQARDLLEQYKRLRVLENLARLEWTHAELESYQKNPQAYLELIKNQGNGVSAPELFSAALDFYQIARSREQSFDRRVRDLLKKENRKTIVVIAGGFHAEGIKTLLKTSGYSYAVVMPRMASLEGQDQYGKIMGGQLSYQQYVHGNLYDAFARAASLELVKNLGVSDFRKTLKLWRDEVIRDLAKQGRAGDASRYTIYIDRLFQTYFEKFGGQGTEVSREALLKMVEEASIDFRQEKMKVWRSDFETRFKSFGDGLQNLIRDKQLTLENVSSLLRSAPASPAAAGVLQLSNAAMEPDLTLGRAMQNYLSPRIAADLNLKNELTKRASLKRSEARSERGWTVAEYSRGWKKNKIPGFSQGFTEIREALSGERDYASISGKSKSVVKVFFEDYAKILFESSPPQWAYFLKQGDEAPQLVSQWLGPGYDLVLEPFSQETINIHIQIPGAKSQAFHIQAANPSLHRLFIDLEGLYQNNQNRDNPVSYFRDRLSIISGSLFLFAVPFTFLGTAIFVLNALKILSIIPLIPVLMVLFSLFVLIGAGFGWAILAAVYHWDKVKARSLLKQFARENQDKKIPDDQTAERRMWYRQYTNPINLVEVKYWLMEFVKQAGITGMAFQLPGSGKDEDYFIAGSEAVLAGVEIFIQRLMGISPFDPGGVAVFVQKKSQQEERYILRPVKNTQKAESTRSEVRVQNKVFRREIPELNSVVFDLVSIEEAANLLASLLPEMDAVTESRRQEYESSGGNLMRARNVLGVIQFITPNTVRLAVAPALVEKVAPGGKKVIDQIIHRSLAEKAGFTQGGANYAQFAFASNDNNIRLQPDVTPDTHPDIAHNQLIRMGRLMKKTLQTMKDKKGGKVYNKDALADFGVLIDKSIYSTIYIPNPTAHEKNIWDESFKDPGLLADKRDQRLWLLGLSDLELVIYDDPGEELFPGVSLATVIQSMENGMDNLSSGAITARNVLPVAAQAILERIYTRGDLMITLLRAEEDNHVENLKSFTRLHSDMQALMEIVDVPESFRASFRKAEYFFETAYAYYRFFVRFEFEIPHLIERLKNKREAQEAAVALVIRSPEDPEVVEYLIAALENEHPVIQTYAAWALGEIGSPRAIAPLERMKRTEWEQSLYEAASNALDRITSKWKQSAKAVLWNGAEIDPDADEVYLVRGQYDNYLVEQRLSPKNIATVYSAKGENSHGSVVLKVFPYETPGVKEPAVLKMWNREITVLKTLAKAPAAVSPVLLDAGETDNYAWFAMEYLEGETLFDQINQSKIPSTEKIPLFLKILDAVGQIHNDDVIHRDLKAEDIFILPGGEVKIADFNASQFGNEAPERRMYTPSYAAPEMVQSQPGYLAEPQADIFSLGVLLFFLLTKRREYSDFPGASVEFYRVVNEPSRYKYVLNGDFSVYFENRLSGKDGFKPLGPVIAKALAKNPADRYASTEEFKQAIETALPSFKQSPDAGEEAGPRSELRIVDSEIADDLRARINTGVAILSHGGAMSVSGLFTVTLGDLGNAEKTRRNTLYDIEGISALIKSLSLEYEKVWSSEADNITGKSYSEDLQKMTLYRIGFLDWMQRTRKLLIEIDKRAQSLSYWARGRIEAVKKKIEKKGKTVELEKEMDKFLKSLQSSESARESARRFLLNLNGIKVLLEDTKTNTESIFLEELFQGSKHAPWQSKRTPRPIIFHPVPGVPPAKIDRELFHIAFERIWSNASWAMASGREIPVEEQVVDVYPSFDEKRGMVQLTATNYGKIPDALLPNLFDVKYDRPKFSFGGVGLTFAATAIKHMGGTVKAENITENGKPFVKFTIEFPVAATPRSELRQDSEEITLKEPEDRYEQSVQLENLILRLLAPFEPNPRSIHPDDVARLRKEAIAALKNLSVNPADPLFEILANENTFLVFLDRALEGESRAAVPYPDIFVLRIEKNPQTEETAKLYLSPWDIKLSPASIKLGQIKPDLPARGRNMNIEQAIAYALELENPGYKMTANRVIALARYVVPLLSPAWNTGIWPSSVRRKPVSIMSIPVEVSAGRAIALTDKKNVGQSTNFFYLDAAKVRPLMRSEARSASPKKNDRKDMLKQIQEEIAVFKNELNGLEGEIFERESIDWTAETSQNERYLTGLLEELLDSPFWESPDISQLGSALIKFFDQIREGLWDYEESFNQSAEDRSRWEWVLGTFKETRASVLWKIYDLSVQDNLPMEVRARFEPRYYVRVTRSLSDPDKVRIMLEEEVVDLHISDAPKTKSDIAKILELVGDLQEVDLLDAFTWFKKDGSGVLSDHVVVFDSRDGTGNRFQVEIDFMPPNKFFNPRELEDKLRKALIMPRRSETRSKPEEANMSAEAQAIINATVAGGYYPFFTYKVIPWQETGKAPFAFQANVTGEDMIDVQALHESGFAYAGNDFFIQRLPSVRVLVIGERHGYLAGVNTFLKELKADPDIKHVVLELSGRYQENIRDFLTGKINFDGLLPDLSFTVRKDFETILLALRRERLENGRSFEVYGFDPSDIPKGTSKEESDYRDQIVAKKIKELLNADPSGKILMLRGWLHLEYLLEQLNPDPSLLRPSPRSEARSLAVDAKLLSGRLNKLEELTLDGGEKEIRKRLGAFVSKREREEDPENIYTRAEVLTALAERQAVIPDDPSLKAVKTPWGIIDLTRLNNIREYRGEYGAVEIARDLELAHWLGLITVAKTEQGIGPSSVFDELKSHKALNPDWGRSIPSWMVWQQVKTSVESLVRGSVSLPIDGKVVKLQFHQGDFSMTEEGSDKTEPLEPDEAQVLFWRGHPDVVHWGTAFAVIPKHLRNTKKGDGIFRWSAINMNGAVAQDVIHHALALEAGKELNLTVNGEDVKIKFERGEGFLVNGVQALPDEAQAWFWRGHADVTHWGAGFSVLPRRLKNTVKEGEGLFKWASLDLNGVTAQKVIDDVLNLARGEELDLTVDKEPVRMRFDTDKKEFLVNQNPVSQEEAQVSFWLGHPDVIHWGAGFSVLPKNFKNTKKFGPGLFNWSELGLNGVVARKVIQNARLLASGTELKLQVDGNEVRLQFNPWNKKFLVNDAQVLPDEAQVWFWRGHPGVLHWGTGFSVLPRDLRKTKGTGENKPGVFGWSSLNLNGAAAQKIILNAEKLAKDGSVVLGSEDGDIEIKFDRVTHEFTVNGFPTEANEAQRWFWLGHPEVTHLGAAISVLPKYLKNPDRGKKGLFGWSRLKELDLKASKKEKEKRSETRTVLSDLIAPEEVFALAQKDSSLEELRQLMASRAQGRLAVVDQILAEVFRAVTEALKRNQNTEQLIEMIFSDKEGSGKLRTLIVETLEKESKIKGARLDLGVESEVIETLRVTAAKALILGRSAATTETLDFSALTTAGRGLLEASPEVIESAYAELMKSGLELRDSMMVSASYINQENQADFRSFLQKDTGTRQWSLAYDLEILAEARLAREFTRFLAQVMAVGYSNAKPLTPSQFSRVKRGSHFMAVISENVPARVPDLLKDQLLFAGEGHVQSAVNVLGWKSSMNLFDLLLRQSIADYGAGKRHVLDQKTLDAAIDFINRLAQTAAAQEAIARAA